MVEHVLVGDAVELVGRDTGGYGLARLLHRARGDAPGDAQASGYAWYVLSILFLVYILNFVDRQIISILAEDIKRAI